MSGKQKVRLKFHEVESISLLLELTARGGGLLPYKRVMGMCCWMGSHFYDWIDYNGVTFLVELLGSHIFEISGIRKFW